MQFKAELKAQLSDELLCLAPIRPNTRIASFFPTHLRLTRVEHPLSTRLGAQLWRLRWVGKNEARRGIGMGSAAVKSKNLSKQVQAKIDEAQKRFADPKYVLLALSELIKEGDLRSFIDFIPSYVSSSPKYKSQEEFAKAIGTTRQTFHRMVCNEDVSMQVLIAAVEQIYKDAYE